jgi:adenosine deaminase CECR1
MFRHIIALICFSAVTNAQSFAEQWERIRDTATPAELYALMWALPKGGDLHHHASLSAYAEDWLAAATDPAVSRGQEFYTRIKFLGCDDSAEPFLRYQNVAGFTWKNLSACARGEYVRLQDMDAATKDAWLSSLKLDRPGEGRDEFFERAVNRITALSRSPYIFSEAMARYIVRYGKENLRYLETQFAAMNAVDSSGQPIASDEVVNIFRQRLAQADVQAARVAVRFQHPIIRFQPNAERNIEAAYATVTKHRDLFVGVNLVGREDNDKGHAPRFLETFRRLRRTNSGVHLSIHGGEVDAPGDQVRQTLLLGAERIGHGVNLITDPDTMLLLRNGRNLIEMNLVSNQLLDYTPDIMTHPFPEYLRFGIPVCLNTDDAGMWDSNITDEYFTAVKNFRLSWEEVVALGRNSLEHSFAPAALKRTLLNNYNVALTDFEQRFAHEKWRERLPQPSPSGYARRRLLGSR